MLIGLTLSLSKPVNAQTSPTLGAAGSFAVLGNSTVTNTGTSVVNGDLGVSPGNAVTGFPPGIVTPPGTIHAGDAVALQAQNDATATYNTLASEACTQNLTGQDLGGLTLTTGVYCFDTSAGLTGALTLDAAGNADAVFVFKIGTTLTTASDSSVLVIGGGTSCNVWWQVGSSATLGTATTFAGNILALASISLTRGANVSGRALALTGAVTMDTNNIGSPACLTPPANTFTPTPSETPTFTPTFTFTPTATETVNGPTAVPPTAPPGSTAVPPTAPPTSTVFFNVTQTSGGGGSGQAVIGLPNAGGGRPQATYWTLEPRR